MEDIELAKRSASPSPMPRALEMTNKKDVQESLNYTATSLYKKLKFLMLTYSVGGLIFKKESMVIGMKKYLNGSLLYSLIILIFLMSNVPRGFTMFHGDEVFGTCLFFKIMECMWILESFGHYIVCLITRDRLSNFFIECEKIRRNNNPMWNTIKRESTMCTITLWLYLCINFGFTTYLLFWTDLYNFYLTPWDKGSKYIVFMEVNSLMMHFYLTFAWVATSALMFVICRTVAHLFQEVTYEVTLLSHEEFLKIEEKFEGLRRRHQKLCHLVTGADDIFSMHIAMSLLGSVIMTCLITYIIAYDDNPSSNQMLIVVIRLFWLSFALLKLTIDCVSGALLNHAVGSPARGYIVPMS